MTPFKARAIIARHIIHDQLAYYGEDGDEWESHPEIGGKDWRLIVDRVREAAPQPVTAADLAAATAVLEARAERSR